MIRSSRTQRKKQNNIKIAKKQVINLSDYNLSDSEYLLLNKGVKFIPTPGIRNIRNRLMKDFNEFARKARCRDLFHDPLSNNELHPFYTKSYYEPAANHNPILENYLHATKMEICKIHIAKCNQNLTKEEKVSLRIQRLRENKDIVIKKADKSSTIVVQNKENYREEGFRQLHNNIHYEEVHFSTANIKASVLHEVEKMKLNTEIDEMTYKFLTHINKCNQAKLYLLPKVHKIKPHELQAYTGRLGLQNNLIIPGRPIIAQCSVPTMTIGHYIDYFLVPLVQKQETYLRDTTDFINKIEAQIIPEATKLVTYDITSMYTNMPIEELITSVSNAVKYLQQDDYKIMLPNGNSLTSLLEILLKNNEFTFEGKKYKQILGASMGSVVSPECCDIRMYEILRNIIDKSPIKNKIITNLRYRDDGFMLIDAPASEIHDFVKSANNEHNHLKFTYDINESISIFLDTTVSKGNDFQTTGKLDVEIYFKPTDTFMYLHRSSAHPPTTFKGIVKGEIIRCMRNTSDKTKHESLIKKYQTRLLKRGYTKMETDKIIRQTRCLSRTALLKQKEYDPKSIPLVFITPFNPRLRKLGKIVRKHWNIIEQNEICSKIFPNPPTIAFKRHKNLIELVNSNK